MNIVYSTSHFLLIGGKPSSVCVDFGFDAKSDLWHWKCDDIGRGFYSVEGYSDLDSAAKAALVDVMSTRKECA